jgi:NAD(P)-dependent dehydrogenase (short-subunit alcohol dehydrogenase family)
VSDRLRGRVAMVTGAGQGIGRAIALRFAAEGAAVAVADVVGENATRTAMELRKSGARAVAVATDVTDSASIDAAARTIEAELGPIDVLANIAGIYGKHAPVRELELVNWERVIAVNLTGGFLCAKRVLPGMVARRWGRILNIASGAAAIGRPKIAPYTASKTAIVAFTKALALEVARDGVTVNCVMPGVSDTAMPREVMSDEALYRLAEQNPMGRIGRPEDIANAMAFLASEDAGYITGQTIAVNGGIRQLP